MHKAEVMPVMTSTSTRLIKPRHDTSGKLSRVPWGVVRTLSYNPTLDCLSNQEVLQLSMHSLCAALIRSDDALQCTQEIIRGSMLPPDISTPLYPSKSGSTSLVLVNLRRGNGGQQQNKPRMTLKCGTAAITLIPQQWLSKVTRSK